MEKARAAKSPEELLKIAHDNGQLEFTEENARVYFNALNHRGELSDEELDVSAGGCALRAHNQKMVSAVNYCGHWKCKYHNNDPGDKSYLRKKETYLDESLLLDCDGSCKPDKAVDRSCYTCYYCSYESAAWWCNNKAHYNE